MFISFDPIEWNEIGPNQIHAEVALSLQKLVTNIYYICLRYFLKGFFEWDVYINTNKLFMNNMKKNALHPWIPWKLDEYHCNGKV